MKIKSFDYLFENEQSVPRYSGNKLNGITDIYHVCTSILSRVDKTFSDLETINHIRGYLDRLDEQVIYFLRMSSSTAQYIPDDLPEITEENYDEVRSAVEKILNIKEIESVKQLIEAAESVREQLGILEDKMSNDFGDFQDDLLIFNKSLQQMHESEMENKLQRQVSFPVIRLNPDLNSASDQHEYRDNYTQLTDALLQIFDGEYGEDTQGKLSDAIGLEADDQSCSAIMSTIRDSFHDTGYRAESTVRDIGITSKAELLDFLHKTSESVRNIIELSKFLDSQEKQAADLKESLRKRQEELEDTSSEELSQLDISRKYESLRASVVFTMYISGLCSRIIQHNLNIISSVIQD